jgi:hypothetical protein
MATYPEQWGAENPLFPSIPGATTGWSPVPTPTTSTTPITTTTPTVASTSDPAKQSVATTQNAVNNITTGVANQKAVVDAKTQLDADNTAKLQAEKDQRDADAIKAGQEYSLKQQELAQKAALLGNGNSQSSDTSGTNQAPDTSGTVTLQTQGDVRNYLTSLGRDPMDFTGVSQNADGTWNVSWVPKTSTQTPAETTADAEQKIIDLADKAYTDYKNSIDQLNNGTFPLTSGEQAQITEMQRMFDQMKQDQITANKNYEGIMTQAGIVSGRQRYAPEIEAGNMKQAIDSGLAKISDIESKAASSIDTLKQSFIDKDYEKINTEYTNLQKYLSDKTTAIKEMNQTIKDEAAQLRQDNLDKLAAAKGQQEISKGIIDSLSALVANNLTGDATKDMAMVKGFADQYGIDANQLYSGAITSQNTQADKNKIGGDYGTYIQAIQQGYLDPKTTFADFQSQLNPAKPLSDLDTLAKQLGIQNTQLDIQKKQADLNLGETSSSTGYNFYDASRPDISNQFVIDDKVNGTPAMVWQDGINYALKGASALSGMGLGQKQQVINYRTAVRAKGDALAQAAGTTTAELQQSYAAASTSLKKQVTNLNVTDTALQRAVYNGKQLVDLFGNKNINLYDATYANTKLNDLSKNFGDSADIRAYQAGLQEVANDYSTVFSRGGQRSVETDKRAQDILNGNITIKDLVESLNTLQTLGNGIINASKSQIENLDTDGTLSSFYDFVYGNQGGNQASNLQNQGSNLPSLTQSYNSLDSLLKDNPGYSSSIDEAKNNGYSDSEILQFLQQGFNQGGGGTPTATKNYGLGNIDLNNRPIIQNSDGSISTVRSISINEDGKEVLIPTVRQGLNRIMTNQEAIDYYHKTGEYLGKFNSTQEADKYSEQLHQSQEQQYSTVKKVSTIQDGVTGGQCGAFVNKVTGLGLGDSYQSKMAKMDKNIKSPKSGMVFVMPYKDTGHTGIILAVNNGIATVKDSNYSLDGKVKTHKIPVSKMTGFKMV